MQPSDLPSLPEAPRTDGPTGERLRVLLSQAVQDQVSEQRALTAALADLRQRVDAVAQQLAATATHEALADVAGALGRLGHEVPAAVEVSAEATRAALTERLAATEESVERALERVDAGVTGGLRALEDRVGGSLADGLRTVEERLVPMAAAVDGLAARPGVEALRPAVEALQPAVEALRPELASLSVRLVELPDRAAVRAQGDAVVRSLTGSLSRLEEALGRTATEEGVTGVLGRLDELATRPVASPGDVETAAVGLTGRLEASDARAAEVLEAVRGLHERTGALEAGLADGLTGVVESLATVAGRLLERLPDARLLERTGSGVEAVAADLAALRGRLDEPGPEPDLPAPVLDRLAQSLLDTVGPALVAQVTEAVRAQLAAAPPLVGTVPPEPEPVGTDPVMPPEPVEPPPVPQPVEPQPVEPQPVEPQPVRPEPQQPVRGVREREAVSRAVAPLPVRPRA